MQGQRKIQLFYNVKHKEERDVLYDFILEGDGLKGYKIYRVDIRDQARHPMNSSVTKKDKNIFSEITVDGIKR